jgi:uncharacterized protein (DUF362 family)
MEQPVKRDPEEKKVNRRTFMGAAASAAAALSLPVKPFFIISRSAAAADHLRDARVVIVRDMAAHSGSQIVSSVAQVIMDEAIRRYTGLSDVGEAYRSVFPGVALDSVIGIKINCINTSVPTHPAVVAALTNGLQKMTFSGTPFPANNILIWDRTQWELQSSGYTINTGSTGVRCFATGTSGIGYATMYLNCNGSQQHPSRILTDYCDYLVNFSVMKNHTMAGVTFSLKNHLGSVHNPGGLHGGYGNPYIPALNAQIRDVLAVEETLFLVDSIFGIYTGGPGGSANMIYDGILISQDHVAVDAVGRSILQSYGCPTIGISGHVDTAAQAPYNLGTANLSLIEQINVMNPSRAVSNLSVIHSGADAVLNWSTPEYTGLFKVRRSLDPEFGTFTEIATVSGNSYTDVGAVNSSIKYFYRIVKSW